MDETNKDPKLSKKIVMPVGKAIWVMHQRLSSRRARHHRRLRQCHKGVHAVDHHLRGEEPQDRIGHAHYTDARFAISDNGWIDRFA